MSSDNYWDDDEDDQDTDTDEQLDGNSLVKKLRKAKRSDEKRIKELTEQLEGLSKGHRERIVKEVLEKQGVSPKIARLILKDLEGEVTEETVLNYLEDNAEVFGLEVQYEGASESSQADLAAIRQQDNFTQGASTPTSSPSAEQRINAATTEEEMLLLIGGQQTT